MLTFVDILKDDHLKYRYLNSTADFLDIPQVKNYIVICIYFPIGL